MKSADSEFFSRLFFSFMDFFPSPCCFLGYLKVDPTLVALLSQKPFQQTGCLLGCLFLSQFCLIGDGF